MTSDTVLLTFDGPVAVVSMNRPDRHNAFNDEMDARFFEILTELHERDDVRAIVWRGEGKSFSSGRDTKELGKRSKGESDLEFIQAGHDKTRMLFTMPAPVVVALKGWVLGGSFERALLCDIRIAADDARMGLPETAHGSSTRTRRCVTASCRGWCRPTSSTRPRWSSGTRSRSGRRSP